MSMSIKNLSYVSYTTLIEGLSQTLIDECTTVLANTVAWGDSEFTIITSQMMRDTCIGNLPKNAEEELLYARLTHLIEQGVYVDMES
jgi:hypothetical protein